MDPSPHSRFATTQWTLVWNAAVEDSKHGRPALSEIMRRYWLPLYGFARQRGLSSADAEDATQEFLLHLFDDDILAKADPAKGRFRSFLLTVWKSFLIDRYRQGMRQKRGAGANHVPIEFAESEARWQDVMGRSKLADPEVAYTSTWAQQLLQQALTNLKSEYQASGKGSLFEAFRPFLTKSLAAVDAEKIAKDFGMSVSGVKVALHRCRQKFGAILRSLVSETVDDPGDVDAEMSELLRALLAQGQ